MSKLKKIGVALCGSFCTFADVLIEIEELLHERYDIIPIMSFNASSIDTRFGTADFFINKLENLTSNKVIKTIEDAEPIGPKNLIDLLLIAPCTGNTLSKLAHGITDSPVLMAAKSHIRNNKPVVIALATNDGLGASFQNIGILLNSKNFYLVPFGQDNYNAKPKSLVSKMELIPKTIEYAFTNKQLQPCLESPQ